MHEREILIQYSIDIFKSSATKDTVPGPENASQQGRDPWTRKRFAFYKGFRTSTFNNTKCYNFAKRAACFFILWIIPCLTQAVFENAGEKYCQQKQWDKAVEYYKTASTKKNCSWAVPFNLGVAHYNLSQWDDAITSFKDSLGRCREVAKQESIFYNLGNALYRKGEGLSENEARELEEKISLLEESLKAYIGALDLKKSNDTQHNHDWVKAQLERLKKKQETQNNESQQDEEKENKEDKKQDQQNKEDKEDNSENSQNDSQKEKDKRNEPNPSCQENQKEIPQTPQQQEMQNVLNASQKEEQKLPLLLLDSTNETTKKDW